MKVAILNRMRRNDRAMIRWICNVKAKVEVSSDSLLSKLGIQDLDMVLRTSRMRWFGHVERSTGWIAKVCKLNAVAQKRPGRPTKTWDEVLVDDRKKLVMDKVDQDTIKVLFQKYFGSVLVSVSDQGTSPSYQKVIS